MFTFVANILDARSIRDFDMARVCMVLKRSLKAGDIDPEWMPLQYFIEKPVTAERLLSAVTQLLQP